MRSGVNTLAAGTGVAEDGHVIAAICCSDLERCHVRNDPKIDPGRISYELKVRSSWGVWYLAQGQFGSFLKT